MKKRVRKDTTLDSTEQLIYDIVFGQKKQIVVKLSQYVSDLLHHETFCQKVKDALVRTGFTILEDDVKMDSTEMYWTFTLKVNNR